MTSMADTSFDREESVSGADTATEASVTEIESPDSSRIGYRIRPRPAFADELHEVANGEDPGTAAAIGPTPGTVGLSHFAPKSGRNRRRRRNEGVGLSHTAKDGDGQESLDTAKVDIDTTPTRRISRSRSRDRIRNLGTGTPTSTSIMGIFDIEIQAWSITTSQLLHMTKIVLFTLWVVLFFVSVVHLHWYRTDVVAGVGSGVISSVGGGGSGGVHLLPPLAGLEKGKKLLRIDGGSDTTPVVPPAFPPLFHRPGAPRTHIPLPLPPNKASVVLMNYSRPRMVQESTLMRTLLAHPNVDEVILLHSNPNTAFHFVHPKVVNVDSTRQNDEMGLSLRFYFCQLAKNPWVIHVDDDMEFELSTLSELFIEFARNPRRIVGRFGRDTVGDENSNSFNGYSSRSTHKQTEVILTKLLLMERQTCSAFFEHSHLIWEDTVLNNGEGPLWNGEDIFMSLVANHLYGHDGTQSNYAMDWLDVYNAPDSLKDYDNGKLDISGGMTGYRLWDWHWWQSLMRRNRHYAYRGKLWNTARKRLKEIGEL